MSAGSISLESAIRSCKVNTAWANRVESDRFLNSDNVICPLWNGLDSTGRQVCKDSFYTKRSGCNSASDRVKVENEVSRPQYMQYITLSTKGIKGDIYDSSMQRSKEIKGLNKTVGNFGKQYGSVITPSCGYNAYKNAMNREQDKIETKPKPEPKPEPKSTPDTIEDDGEYEDEEEEEIEEEEDDIEEEEAPDVIESYCRRR